MLHHQKTVATLRGLQVAAYFWWKISTVGDRAKTVAGDPRRRGWRLHNNSTEDHDRRIVQLDDYLKPPGTERRHRTPCKVMTVIGYNTTVSPMIVASRFRCHDPKSSNSKLRVLPRHPASQCLLWFSLRRAGAISPPIVSTLPFPLQPARCEEAALAFPKPEGATMCTLTVVATETKSCASTRGFDQVPQDTLSVVGKAIRRVQNNYTSIDCVGRCVGHRSSPCEILKFCSTSSRRLVAYPQPQNTLAPLSEWNWIFPSQPRCKNLMGCSRHSFERAQSSDYIVVAVKITKPRWSVTLRPRQHDCDMSLYFLCSKLL